MFRFLGLCFGTRVRLLRSRQRLLENMVLRQQLVVLKRRHRRPRLDRFDRLFWLLVRRCWSGWKEALLVVTPETAVRWHRAGFRWYWTVISKPRKPIARRRTSQEVRDLNFQMVAENPNLGCTTGNPDRESSGRWSNCGSACVSCSNIRERELRYVTPVRG
jgi:hypothetical protein